MTTLSGASGDPAGARHYRALDGLRGIAIIAVFLFHARIYIDTPAWGALPAFSRVCMAGIHGVDLFFVLSGFLITGILLKAKQTSNYFTVFYARRTLRIFPIYYLVILVIFFGLPLIGVGAFYPWQVQRWYWINLSSWSSSFGAAPTEITHFWTLANEEQFYLIWPLLVRWLRERTLIALSVSLIFLEYGARLFVYYRFHTSPHYFPELIRRLFPLNVDLFFVGALLALLLQHRAFTSSGVRGVRIATVLVTLFTAFTMTWTAQGHFWMSSLGLEAVAMMTAGVITLVVAHPKGFCSRLLSIAPFRLAGRYSYCMYLIHLPLIIVLQVRVLAGHHIASPLLAGGILLGIFLTCFGIAALSWRLIEEPILGLKRHFLYRM